MTTPLCAGCIQAAQEGKLVTDTYELNVTITNTVGLHEVLDESAGLTLALKERRVFYKRVCGVYERVHVYACTVMNGNALCRGHIVMELQA